MDSVIHTVCEAAKRHAHLPGDFCEIGLNSGACFREFIKIAAPHNKLTWGFDSFYGMGEPGPKDGTGYPKGRFSMGGPAEFTKTRMTNVSREKYRLVPGFVPETLSLVPDDLVFCVARLDVDHYQPTKDTLPWLYNRVVSGGALLLDDFFPDLKKGSANQAIHEWLEETGIDSEFLGNRTLLVVK